MRGWLVPIGAGLVAAMITMAIPVPTHEPEPEQPQEMGDDGVTFVFQEGPRMASPRGDILVIADGFNPTNVSWPAADGTHFELSANITWHNDKLGTIAITQDTIYCIRAPCPQPAAPWSIQFPGEGAVVGPGNDTIVVTLFIFDLGGELVATNAPASTLGEFTLSSEYLPLSTAPWYLGNSSAPAGAQVLPFGQQIAAAALTGLPTGAIATVYLETHPYDWYIGPLWLTAKIDGFA